MSSSSSEVVVPPSGTVWRGSSGVMKPATTSFPVWIFIMGFLVGILATLTVTILVGWLIDVSVPHSSWLNKAFYGYALGCQ